MNWDAVGAVAELVGAMAVMLTLVYLALQIQQNTRSLKAAAAQAVTKESSDTYSALAFDADMSRIYWAGLRDLNSLERLDRLRFVTYMASTIKPWENVLAQVELGTLDAKMMEGGRREMLRHFSQPGMQQWWVRGREAFSSELVAFVDNEILPVVASMENQRSDR